MLSVPEDGMGLPQDCYVLQYDGRWRAYAPSALFCVGDDVVLPSDAAALVLEHLDARDAVVQQHLGSGGTAIVDSFDVDVSKRIRLRQNKTHVSPAYKRTWYW